MSASNAKAAAAKAKTEKSTDMELNDDIVRDYLKKHDDFLQRNPDLLDFLRALTDPAALDMRTVVPAGVPSGLQLAE